MQRRFRRQARLRLTLRELMAVDQVCSVRVLRIKHSCIGSCAHWHLHCHVLLVGEARVRWSPCCRVYGSLEFRTIEIVLILEFLPASLLTDWPDRHGHTTKVHACGAMPFVRKAEMLFVRKAETMHIWRAQQ